jgi:ribonuclease D
MSPASPPQYIDTPTDLQSLVDHLAPSPTIALDTEFHAERRYRPDLMLVQLSAPGQPVYTVDPLALDLQPLHPVLHDKTWVAHGAERDIQLLHDWTGARPARLVDTQILAGFAGIHFPARLDVLALEALGSHIDKGSTLSDWHQRPLSDAQLDYARADVRLLCPLADALRDRIARLDAQISGRDGLKWADQAGKALVQRSLSPRKPDEPWRTLDIASRLDGPTRAALHALYVWREEEARRKNSPPHYILSPSVALDLARRRPKSTEEIRENRRIPNGLVKRHGALLLRLLAGSLHVPPPPPVGDSQRSGVRPLLEAWLHSTAGDLHIAPALLAPRQMIRDVVVSGADALTGWQSEALETGIDGLLRGEISLSIGTDGIVTTENPVRPARQRSLKSHAS